MAGSIITPTDGCLACMHTHLIFGVQPEKTPVDIPACTVD